MSLLSAFQLRCLTKAQLESLLTSKFNALSYALPGSLEELQIQLAISQLQRELSQR